MTQEEVKEGNKLIAEFMGGLYKSKIYPTDRQIIVLPIERNQYVDNLKYNSSWDWLMPVVEKIESLGYAISIEKNICTIYNKLSLNSGGAFCNIIKESKTESTYHAIVKFIKWYNEKV